MINDGRKHEHILPRILSGPDDAGSLYPLTILVFFMSDAGSKNIGMVAEDKTQDGRQQRRTGIRSGPFTYICNVLSECFLRM